MSKNAFLSHGRGRAWLLVFAAGLSACGGAPKSVPPSPDYGRAASGPSDYAWTPAMGSVQGQLSHSLRGSSASVARTEDDRVWITLPGEVAFEPTRSALKPQARTLLDRIALALRKAPEAEIRVVGHTDATGSAAANKALSLDRAASTRDWLVARGIAATRFKVAGRASLDALGAEKTEAARARNRRVEILIGERKGSASVTK